MVNKLYIPFINPIRFYEVDKVVLDKYYTKHFDDFEFSKRLYGWQPKVDYDQIWQDTDIIKLQFTSNIDPIIVSLIDEYGQSVITLPALVGLPNKFELGTYSYEVAMSLASVPSGCYRVKITAGSDGPLQKIYISDCQNISSEVITESICIEYSNSRFTQDVIFETGIKFQFRCFGHFAQFEPTRKDEYYKDQRYNPTLLNSKIGRQYSVYFSNELGISDDTIDLINRIWACDNVLIDNKSFCIAENAKLEFVQEEGYPLRGLKLNVEEGINRNSKVMLIDGDPTKKIISTIIVDAAVFGDTGTQNSNNTVPVHNIQID